MNAKHGKVFHVTVALRSGDVHAFFFPYEGNLTPKRYQEFAEKFLAVPGVPQAFKGAPSVQAAAEWLRSAGGKETGFEISTCETDENWVKYATDSSGGFQPKELVHVL